jgi:hypothetical protein
MAKKVEIVKDSSSKVGFENAPKLFDDIKV